MPIIEPGLMIDMRSVIHNLRRTGHALGRRAAAALLLVLLALPAQAQTAVTKYAAMVAAAAAMTARKTPTPCTSTPSALRRYRVSRCCLVRVTAALPDDSPANSPRLLVICRQHGDEPVSTQAALLWLSHCAVDDSGAASANARRRPRVYIVPMANPDGADQLSRFTGTSGDMNRDWGVFALPETRALYAAYKQIAPTAVVDMHSWDVTDPFQANSVEAESASYSGAQPATLSVERATKPHHQGGPQPDAADGQRPELLAGGRHTALPPLLCRARGTPSVLVETAAGPSDSRDDMASRVQYDLAALSGAVQAVSTDFANTASPPQSSQYLLSADALAGRVRPQLASVLALPRPTAAQLAARRVRAIRVALALYASACAVLIAVCRKTLASAWGRLLTRRRVRGIASGGYISIRLRHYPPDMRHKTGEIISASVRRHNAAIRCR